MRQFSELQFCVLSAFNLSLQGLEKQAYRLSFGFQEKYKDQILNMFVLIFCLASVTTLGSTVSLLRGIWVSITHIVFSFESWSVCMYYVCAFLFLVDFCLWLVSIVESREVIAKLSSVLLWTDYYCYLRFDFKASLGLSTAIACAVTVETYLS